MADLKVDFDLLEDSSSSLEEIYKAFDGLKSRSSHTSSDWGSHDIAGAMGSFSGDWDNHREKTMQSLESMKKMCDEALDGFRKTDAKLAASFEQTRVTKDIHGSAE